SKSNVKHQQTWSNQSNSLEVCAVGIARGVLFSGVVMGLGSRLLPLVVSRSPSFKNFRGVK
ncbi:MAG: hypothetical protein ABFD15_07710, partial [Methanofastidiosum sp.]